MNTWADRNPPTIGSVAWVMDISYIIGLNRGGAVGEETGTR
jgi:hypothetical protein